MSSCLRPAGQLVTLGASTSWLVQTAQYTAAVWKCLYVPNIVPKENVYRAHVWLYDKNCRRKGWISSLNIIHSKGKEIWQIWTITGEASYTGRMKSWGNDQNWKLSLHYLRQIKPKNWKRHWDKQSCHNGWIIKRHISISLYVELNNQKVLKEEHWLH